MSALLSANWFTDPPQTVEPLSALGWVGVVVFTSIGMALALGAVLSDWLSDGARRVVVALAAFIVGAQEYAVLRAIGPADNGTERLAVAVFVILTAAVGATAAFWTGQLEALTLVLLGLVTGPVAYGLDAAATSMARVPISLAVLLGLVFLFGALMLDRS